MHGNPRTAFHCRVLQQGGHAVRPSLAVLVGMALLSDRCLPVSRCLSDSVCDALAAGPCQDQASSAAPRAQHSTACIHGAPPVCQAQLQALQCISTFSSHSSTMRLVLLLPHLRHGDKEPGRLLREDSQALPQRQSLSHLPSLTSPPFTCLSP